MPRGKQDRAEHEGRGGSPQDGEQARQDDAPKNELLGKAIDEDLYQQDTQHDWDGQSPLPQERRAASQQLAQRCKHDASRGQHHAKHEATWNKPELVRP